MMMMMMNDDDTKNNRKVNNIDIRKPIIKIIIQIQIQIMSIDCYGYTTVVQ